MASATLSDATIALINNECKKETAPEISRMIARCRGHMTTIRTKMDGNVRTLKTVKKEDTNTWRVRIGLAYIEIKIEKACIACTRIVCGQTRKDML